jgi:hypothetical protein
MGVCERLTELLARFEADGNEAAAEGIRAAMAAAGCGAATAEDDSGGTGGGPPKPPEPVGP